MEHVPHASETADRPRRVPPIVWFLGLGLVAALIAIFLFNVAVDTVVYYGLIALMVGSHFFMHGSHGGHAGHGQPGTPTEAARSDKDQHAGHSGGCH